MKYILGINDGHCATACLLRDGEIVGAVSEERFKRIKNWAGFPTESVKWLLSEAGIKANQVDALVLNYKRSGLQNLGTYLSAEEKDPSGGKIYQKLLSIYWPLSYLLNAVEYRFRSLRPFSEWTMVVGEKIRSRLLSKRRLQPILELGISLERVLLCDHQDSHIYSLLGWERLKDETLIVSVDGEGDLLCATVSVYRDGKFKRIATTGRSDSLGLLYAGVTKYMGMKPLEHEYKIMGLAPYCNEHNLQKTLPVFKRLIGLSRSGLSFRSRHRCDLFSLYLEKNLRPHRFDAIAGALQRHTENLLTRLVRNAIQKKGIHRVGLSGGVFMNVKANMLISQMSEVEELFVFPSCGDDSTAVGAAFWAHHQNTGQRPASISKLYLGPSYDDRVAQVLREQRVSERHRVEKPEAIEERVADLLAEGKIVARCSGKMEWGARALGNRSIMANPSDSDIIREINEQIKKRDFWMPFTPSILEERSDDYLINPKSLYSPYMIVAFDSTELAQKELKAAMHPYDFTIRPQVVRQSWNPSYHKTIKEFEKRTGIGGVLNTSFNIHGEPIVCTPEDAIDVFDRSGLEYLVLGDYLITK